MVLYNKYMGCWDGWNVPGWIFVWVKGSQSGCGLVFIFMIYAIALKMDSFQGLCLG